MGKKHVARKKGEKKNPTTTTKANTWPVHYIS